ncbi:hypothetical protein MNV49_004339 [Pseudohyphozyma bogoriensis]|nr:hypothetical protein MNV49_004339 [Pseudohyphozyma bogoriensis]
MYNDGLYDGGYGYGVGGEYDGVDNSLREDMLLNDLGGPVEGGLYDGSFETALYDGDVGLDGVGLGGGGLYGGYDDDLGLGGGYLDSYGTRGLDLAGVGGGYGYGGGGLGYGSYGANDYLWNETDFIDSELPLGTAWGGFDDWNDYQYQLSDLMYYQNQLESDRLLDESERLRRFEERLAWEQLADSERHSRWATMDALQRQRLGLTGGWWARRYENPNLDLSYLRSVPLQRGVFSTPYRNVFSRYRGLHSRFSPYLSRNAIIPYRSGGVGYRGPAVAYGSRPIAAGPSLQNQQLRMRLRMAETRASMAGLSAAARGQALEDARRIRAEINAELRGRADVDRQIRTDNAINARLELVETEREQIRDVQAARDRDRLLNRGGLVPYTSGYGGYGGGRMLGRPRSFVGY